MPLINDDPPPISQEQVMAAYLQAIQLIDRRVAPFLGKITTRVLVQAAAKRIVLRYPFLSFLVSRPYTDLIPSVIHEQMRAVTPAELAAGLHALLDTCFAGLRELTGDLIAPPIHAEVCDQLRLLQ